MTFSQPSIGPGDEEVSCGSVKSFLRPFCTVPSYVLVPGVKYASSCYDQIRVELL